MRRTRPRRGRHPGPPKATGLFLTLRRLVDRDLSWKRPNRAWSSIILGMLPLAVAAGLQELGSPVGNLIGVLAVGMSGAWFLFVAWRGWRLVKAAAVKSDRDYDRSERRMLPPEYARTESATAARGRARQDAVSATGRSGK